MASAAVTTAALEGVPYAHWRRRIENLPNWAPYALIVIVCFLIRLPTFGNPMLGFDEQLYLLVGDRMLHGQLPYLDLWDRKPIGLFLFYAGVRAFGGTGIIQYQIAATLCVAATASFIWTIARRSSGPAPAFVGVVAYVLVLNVLNGGGGQAPVVYNVLTACAAWAAFRANDTRSPALIAGLALLAMAMMGVAIQFKYTPMVEGAFFGCWFLWRMWQIATPLPKIVLVALAMMATALLPTIAAIGYYAWIGHLDAFVHANFLSIFDRVPFPAITRHNQIKFICIKAICVIAPAPFALALRWQRRTEANLADFWLLTGWTVFAVIGFGLLGDFYDFYFISVLLPLSIVIVPLIRPGLVGFAIACMLTLWPAILTPKYFWHTPTYERAAQQLTDAVAPYVTQRCLYIYDGPAIIYLLSHACAPSRYIYPDHLTNPTEAHALGVDPVAEEARILATRPGAIITADRPVIPRVNPATQRLVRNAIVRDYVLVDRVPAIDRVFYVWALEDLHPRPFRGSDPYAGNLQ